MDKQKRIILEIQNIDSFISKHEGDDRRERYVAVKKRRKEKLLQENAKISLLLETAEYKLNDSLVTLLNDRTKCIEKIKEINNKLLNRQNDEFLDVYFEEYKQYSKMYQELEMNLKKELESSKYEFSNLDLNKLENQNVSDMKFCLDYAKNIVDLNKTQDSIDSINNYINTYILALVNENSAKAREQEKNRTKELEKLYIEKKRIQENIENYHGIKFDKTVALKILKKEEIENELYELDNSVVDLDYNQIDELISKKRKLLNELKECNEFVHKYFSNKMERKKQIIVEIKRLNLNSERNIENLELLKLESVNNKYSSSINVGINQIKDAIIANKLRINELKHEFLSIGNVLGTEVELLESELNIALNYIKDIENIKNNKNAKENQKLKNEEIKPEEIKNRKNLQELFADYTMNGDVLNNIERYGTSYISKIKCDLSLNQPIQQEPTNFLKQKIELYKKKKEYKKLLSQAKITQHDQSEAYGMLNRQIEYLENEIEKEKNGRHR